MEPIAPIDALDAVPAVRAFIDADGSQPLFIGPALQQRLDLIEHLLEFGRQIIVMTGGEGSGKTAVLDHLADGQRPNWCLVRLDAQAEAGPDALLEMLVEALEIDVGEAVGPELEGRVRARIDALERAGKVVVLLVDDADQLQPEAAQLLVRLAHTEEQRAELRILFAADPGRAPLLDILQQANPQPGLVHMVELPPLLDDQVREFLRHRMRVAGFDPEEYFTGNDYERIAALTDGKPANVMALARQTLVELERLGLGAQRPQETSRGLTRMQVNLAFAALAVLAIVGGAWWANLKPMDAVTTERVELDPLGPAPAEPIMPLESSSTATGSLPEPAPMAQPGQTEAVATTPPDAEPALGLPGTESTAVPLTEATVPAPAESPPEPTALPPAGSEAPDAPAAAEAVTTLPPPTGEAPATAEVAPAPGAPATAAPEPAPIPAPEVVAPPAPTPAMAAAPAKPKPVAPKPAPASAPPRSATGLLDQPASAHTLQLLGLSDRAKAERFVRERGIAAQSSILTTQLNGRPFFLIVYGSYPSRSAAVAASRQLPATLKDTKPWARSVGSLRSALK